VKVLLINPGHSGEHYTHQSDKRIHRDPPPMSILSVGTELKRQGAKVDILDTHVETDWQKTLSSLLRRKYDWIGLSVIIGQPMANAAEIQAFIRKEIRKPPLIKWGGIMPTVMPDAIKEAYGPDEVTPGPCGELAAIDWSLLGDKCNIQQQPYYQMIMSSRGCPFSCTFCYKHSIDHPSVRYRSAEDVCAEMDWLYQNVGTTVFTFGDDNFLTRASRAIVILDHCRAKGYYVEECIGHINNLTEPLIAAMAGVVQTFIFSIETVSPYLQELLKKRVRLHEVKAKIEKLARVGIVCNISYMIGLPGETDSDLRLNWMYMGSLREAHPYLRGNCYIWLPLPKTVLTTYAEQKYGVSLDFPVRDYEHANFWLRHDDPHGYHFRPYLTEERYHQLIGWGLRFNEAFKRPDGRRFYILDEVLDGKKPRLGESLV
jgi:hypothetical protein